MSKDEQQTHGGFVPLGELADALPGFIPRGREMSAQARHHFTTLRQVNQLIEASEADADRGFIARLLALCSLPRTNPSDRHEFKRVNWPYTLYMTATAGNKLPYGNIPRLLLAWVCSEAVRTQRRELVLWRSLYEFMRKLGMGDRSGSARGDRTRLKNQMCRLFSTTVALGAGGVPEVVLGLEVHPDLRPSGVRRTTGLPRVGTGAVQRLRATARDAVARLTAPRAGRCRHGRGAGRPHPPGARSLTVSWRRVPESVGEAAGREDPHLAGTGATVDAGARPPGPVLRGSRTRPEGT